MLPSLPIGKSILPREKKYSLETWEDIRNQFEINPDRIHMAQMLFASHPKPVRDTIEMHRKGLDMNPVEYLEERLFTQDNETRKAAAQYLNSLPEEVVLTDSTTMALATLYGGLKLKPGDEILTTTHDHYSTEKSLEYNGKRHGATLNRVMLYKDPFTASEDEIVSALVKAVTPSTRIVAVTWVHSSTGVKLPLKLMSDAIRKINDSRDEDHRIYFCVDGVHGFGIEDVTMEDLGCDFFAAGTHKWLFGPRGTGILWGKKEAWKMMMPTIPSFGFASYGNWLGLVPEEQLNFGDWVSPGGFHSYEHRWALKEAFEFHLNIGKGRIQERTHQLNTLLKDGLMSLKNIKLHTPLSPALSAGINCFEVEGVKPEDVVKKLLEKKIVSSSTPYRVVYVRLTPCMINSEEDVENCINELEKLKV
jgi:selenocysteine lyase/cysteine desulfurase